MHGFGFWSLRRIPHLVLFDLEGKSHGGKEEPPTLHTRAKEGRKEERWHKKKRPSPEKKCGVRSLSGHRMGGGRAALHPG